MKEEEIEKKKLTVPDPFETVIKFLTLMLWNECREKKKGELESFK
jgi:hypothetical protein